jgi:excisionase family DNA binding protein|tara:strand:- start:327 stop:617 length:291 start_codon:yes stop_codon:yes gene_type:complete
MPMDWNQDPYLQRLEEKLDRIAERLDLIEETMGQPKRFYSIQEVAEILGIKERTVRHHINETKLLPYLKISKKIIIREEDLSGFIESQLKNKLLKE